MDLNKNTIKGVGILTFLGVIAAAGFLVVKPQIEESFSLMKQTQEVEDSTELREIRLSKLQSESSNLQALTDEVNDLLVTIPSEKDVTDIAGAVIEAMPPGVQLVSFSHGELTPGAPSFTVPKSSLTTPEPPFELVPPGQVDASPEGEETPVEDEESTPNAEAETEAAEASAATPPFAAAPFIIEVRASGVESLTNFLDILQFQERLITVVSVSSSSADGGETSATIYAYAFAGNNPQIELWENPPAEEE